MDKNYLFNDMKNIDSRTDYGKGMVPDVDSRTDYGKGVEPDIMIIYKDPELFQKPLSQYDFDRIVASPNYRCLIDILEDQLNRQQSNGIKR